MFRLKEVRRNTTTPAIGLIANFTSRFDAYYLLNKVFWCGIFTNIFTDFDSIFPTRNDRTSLHGSGPYWVHEGREAEMELDISPKVAGEKEAEEWMLSSPEKKKQRSGSSRRRRISIRRKGRQG
ncbi:hypothetical protein D1007_33068 [Hordeum vulgare]|nr:hypothetical protein D1007_33068 [Hordeum vulgare]